MKTLILFMSFFCVTSISYAQKQLISYEDLKYLLENNLGKADTFLTAKGYSIVKINKKNNNRRYVTSMSDGTKSAVELRQDGKRISVEIITDDISQFNMIHNSISSFLLANTSYNDIQAYDVKDLGMIYISVNDTVPYSPIRKDYAIHLVAQKGITSLN
ncbi:MAG: hypothetical protein V4592_15695 [Bacteroidota bacterium]